MQRPVLRRVHNSLGHTFPSQFAPLNQAHKMVESLRIRLTLQAQIVDKPDKPLRIRS
jgi:hypothetical protein